MDLANIAVVAFAIAGLVLAPFLAESITSYAIQNYNEGLAPVFNETPDDFSTSDASKYPGMSSDKLGPEVFRKSVDTAFGRFTVEISNRTLEMELDNLNSRVVAASSPQSQRWLLQTNLYTLEIEKTSDRVSEEIRVPSGWCRRVLENGSAEEECKGSMSDLDDLWEEAKSQLRDALEKMEAAAKEIEVINLNSVQWKYR